MEINCVASTESQCGGGGLIPLSKVSEKNFLFKQQTWLKERAYHGSYSWACQTQSRHLSSDCRNSLHLFGHSPTPVIRFPLIWCYFPLHTRISVQPQQRSDRFYVHCGFLNTGVSAVPVFLHCVGQAEQSLKYFSGLKPGLKPKKYYGKQIQFCL